MKIYHNPRCSKSRQTLQIIKDAGVEPEVIEYLKDVPSEAELKEVIALLGIKPYDLLRRGEADFRENFKGKDLSDDEWVAAMVKYPKLIERPIVVKQKKAAIESHISLLNINLKSPSFYFKMVELKKVFKTIELTPNHQKLQTELEELETLLSQGRENMVSLVERRTRSEQ